MMPLKQEPSEEKQLSLEKAVCEYVKESGTDLPNITADHFKAGANWQKEQFDQLFMDLNYQIDLISPYDVSEAGLLSQKIRTILKKFDV